MSGGVVIAGAGVAGLEAALALRALAPSIRVRLVAASDRFVLLPAATALAFQPDLPISAPLSDLLQGTGIEIETGMAAEVDAPGRRLRLADGRSLDYARLIVAVGAVREPYLSRLAYTFRDPHDAVAVRGLVQGLIEAGGAGLRLEVAFVVPPGPGWPLPAYELAFMAAARLAAEGVRDLIGISLVTAEPSPLGVFGPEASAAVGRDLERARIRLWPGAVVGRWEHGRIELIPAGRVPADQVIALPRVRGPRLAGLPADPLGFVRADADGRVREAPGVYVVGDAGPFPVKHGGIGCQQADRVASLAARELGAPVQAVPFEPALRAFLLEGLEERYLRSSPTGGHEDSEGRSWLLRMERMTGKVAGRYLAPLLESRMPQIRLHAVRKP